MSQTKLCDTCGSATPRVSKAAGSQSLLSCSAKPCWPRASTTQPHRYHDFASGGTRRPARIRPAASRALKKGDVLVVWKLDRLGRNLAHRVRPVQDLSARSVGLRVLAGQGAQIDTTTTTGRLVFGIFAALAEFERELIRGRSLGVITHPYKLAFNS